MGSAYAYIKLAGSDKDGKVYRAAVEEFAVENRIGRLEYVVERAGLAKDWRRTALGGLAERAAEGDLVIAPSLLMLSRSLIQVSEILSAFRRKGVRIAVLDAARTIDGGGGPFNEGFFSCLDLVAAYERKLVSLRVREALERRRREGGRVGRPRGSGRSALDPFKERILQAKREGASNAVLASVYNTTPQNISKWLKKNAGGAFVFDCLLYSVSEEGGGERPLRRRLRTARAMVEALIDYAKEQGGGAYGWSDVMLVEEEKGSYILIADEHLGRAFILGFDDGSAPEALRQLKALGLMALS